MGAGIAEVCARSGLEVKVAETTGEALEIGRTRLHNSLSKAAERGKITEEERDATLARLTFTTDLGEFADRDLVIEAVVENEQVKTEIFQVLDQVVTRPDAILASNTSSIPLVKLAVATSRPDQVIGIHFFNPAPVQKLVELIPALTTSRGDRQAGRGPGAGRAGQARRSAPRTVPASSSTRCSSRTCCPRSGCSSPASRAARTSTTAWSWAAPTRWARSSCPT